MIEGTTRRPEVTLGTARLLKDRGYSLEAHVIAAPFQVSLASCFYRYEFQKGSVGFGRFTKTQAHQQAFDALPDSLDILWESALFSEMVLYGRQGMELHRAKGISLGDGNRDDEPFPSEIWRDLVSRIPSEEERIYLATLWDSIMQSTERRRSQAEYMGQVKACYEGYLESVFTIRDNSFSRFFR